MIRPPDSPIWKLARIAVIGTLFIIGAHVWYKNGWSPEDFKTLVMLIGGSLGFDMAKKAITNSTNEEPPQ
jgi:hypothetical protein